MYVKYFLKRALEWIFCLNARCAFRKGSWKVPEGASGCSMVWSLSSLSSNHDAIKIHGQYRWESPALCYLIDQTDTKHNASIIVRPPLWVIAPSLLSLCLVSVAVSWLETFWYLRIRIQIRGSVYLRSCSFRQWPSRPVFRIHDILVWIRIRVAMPLTTVMKVFAYYFLSFEGTFTSFFKDKKS